MCVCLCLYMQNTDCCKICGTSVHCLRKLKIGRYAGSFMGTDVDGEIGELTSNSDLVRCVDFHANLLGNRTVYSLALDGVLENEISECQNSRKKQEPASLSFARNQCYSQLLKEK